jgi:hypothetical protein
MIDSYSFFLVWLGFTILSVCAITVFVIWAIRSGQFSRFDYASRLPLKSMIVADEKSREKNVAQNPMSAGDNREKEDVPA